MKKIIALVATIFFAVIAVSAQPALMMGVRGIYQSSGASIEKQLWDLWYDSSQDIFPSNQYSHDVNTTSSDMNGGGFALFAKIPLGKRFGAQIEFGYTYNSVGLEFSVEEYNTGTTYSTKEKTTFHTLNMPLMLTFDIVQTKNFILTPMVGLYIAKPVGEAGGWLEATINNTALFGAVFGGSMTLRFGSVGLVVDGRYNLGFNSLIVDNTKLFTPRALQISGGLAFMLN